MCKCVSIILPPPPLLLLLQVPGAPAQLVPTQSTIIAGAAQVTAE
jgi:hypothetical protein